MKNKTTISNKRVETLSPFKESWSPSPKTFPSTPPPPNNVLFLSPPTLPSSVPSIVRGEVKRRGEGGVQVKNVTLKSFFPNCGLPSSVSQVLLLVIVA